MNNDIRGVMPAVVLPNTKEGTLDGEGLKKYLEYLISKKVHVLYLFGSTTEGLFYSFEEKSEALKITNEVVSISDWKPSVCAVSIKASTEEMLEELLNFEKIGVDYVSAVAPFYFSHNGDAIYRHYQFLSERVSHPLIAYDIPSCTHNSIDLETKIKISELKNIVGMKDSSGDFLTLSLAMRATDNSNFSWIQGDDILHFSSLISGCAGLVTGGGNINIEPYVKMYDAFEKKDYKEMYRRQKEIDQFRLLYKAGNNKLNPTIRYALSLRGIGSPRMKQNLTSLTSEEQKNVDKIWYSLQIPVV